MDLETAAGRKLRVRPSHALQRPWLGAQLLGAAQIEDGAFSHDALDTTAIDGPGGITPSRIRASGACGSARNSPWQRGDSGQALWLPVPAVSGGPHGPAHNARMPTAQPARHDEAVEGEEDSQRRVAGTVRLMTEDPFELDDANSGVGQRLSSIAAKSPWIIPAVLVGIGVAFLVLRRRR